MQLGISTASFYPMETELALKKIVENKVSCTEIFYNADIEINSIFTDYLLSICKETGIKISAVHPNLSFAEPYYVFERYMRRFDEAREHYRRIFENSAELGAKFVSMHGDRPTGKLPVEEYCERFSVLSQDAKEYGVVLCQENVNGYRSADPEFLADMSNLLGSDANFTLDVKQCIRAGYSVEDIMNVMGNNIRHVHISDHSISSDCLLPKKGGFDFKNLFATLKSKGYDGDFMIEVYENAYADISEIFDSYKTLKTDNIEFFG